MLERDTMERKATLGPLVAVDQWLEHYWEVSLRRIAATMTSADFLQESMLAKSSGLCLSKQQELVFAPQQEMKWV